MGLHRARPTMNGLLVLSTLAAASAQVVLPYGGLAYGGLAGYHGLGYHGLGYPYAVAKPVVNEVEVPVPVIEYAVHETGCKNSFGHAVPCLQEGEARGRGPLTRRPPSRLPLPLPPSCPTDSASDTTVLATLDLATMDSDTLDSATPMPWLPLPLLRLRCP